MLLSFCQPFLSLAIIQLRALSLFIKTVQNRDQLFLYTDPSNHFVPLWDRMEGAWLRTPGLDSETGFHIGMEHNFVCAWRRPNCRSQVINLSLSALIS